MTRHDQPFLPPLLRRLLEAFLPSSRREEILGDLEESYHARAARLGPARARRLLWRETAALVAWRLRRPYPGRGPGRDVVERAWDRRTTMGRDLIRDLRFGARTLARRPGFTAMAVAILGLGIGAPTTVLTLVNRIFFEAPPEVSEPDRLFRAWRSWAPGQGGGSLQHADYLYYRENATTLTGLAAYGGGNFVASFSTGSAESDQLRGQFVSDNYFDVLGVRPVLGRFFVEEENTEPGTHPVMVVSAGFWRRALGGDPAAVGRTVAVNGMPFTVVGVAPAAFRGVSPVEGQPDVWFPIAMAGDLMQLTDLAWWTRLANNRSNWLTLVGRLAPGVTFEAAEANLTALSDALTYEGRNEEEGLLVSRAYLYRPSQARTLQTLSRLLLAVVALVMIIAAANVAVLLLSRALTRGREMGIRTAMGADRGRLVRQLFTESLLLGLAGGAVGVALAYALSDTAASLLPFPFVEGFRPDLRVLAVATALSVLASLLVGLAPALHVARSDLSAAMEVAGDAGRRSRLRDTLVTGQVALSLVLLAGAVLFGRSFWAARTLDTGFATENRLVVQVDLRSQRYTEEEGKAFVAAGLERLAALPGVTGVATSRQIPFQGDWSTEIEPPAGSVPNTDEGKIFVGLNAVSPDYFDVMEIPLVAGRAFGAEEGVGGTPAVIVNETLARLLFPDGDAAGRIATLYGGEQYRIVGVVRNALYYGLDEEPSTQLYLPALQSFQSRVHFILEVQGDAPGLAQAVQATLRELDPDLAFPWVTTLASVMEDQTARYRVSAVLVGLFSALALVLAAAGLYGVVSFAVTQRTREIGVRMALGAPRSRVARDVVVGALRLAAVGGAMGLAGTLWLRTLTGSLLFGTVRSDDPWPLAAALVVLTATAIAAALVPARRAIRVDPVEAMRTE